MKILVTGSAGFLGNHITKYLINKGHHVIGLDNLSRKGSELNADWQRINSNVTFRLCDISDNHSLELHTKNETIDYVIDCAAEPSVLAGFGSTSRKLIDNNLISTINLLELCKDKNAGFILMSTSRVYSIKDLCDINYTIDNERFNVKENGLVDENFSTKPPVSLYGSTKLTSELLAIEYSQMFKFPVWINRCGVIAGPGQFGKIDQGIFSFWIYSWIKKTPVKYIGFEGTGKQVRDIIHPDDICEVINKQIYDKTIEDSPIYNLGGGIQNSMSLKQLSNWCSKNIDDNDIHVSSSSEVRPFDIPIFIMNTEKAEKRWNFKVTVNTDEILKQIKEKAKDTNFLESIC